eukprot:scaffold15141_cov101-Isochrysis_galbana.AAC.3
MGPTGAATFGTVAPSTPTRAVGDRPPLGAALGAAADDLGAFAGRTGAMARFGFCGEMLLNTLWVSLGVGLPIISTRSADCFRSCARSPGSICRSNDPAPGAFASRNIASTSLS